MSLLTSLKFIVNHPLSRGRRVDALAAFLRWQIGSRLVRGEVIHPWINGSKIIVHRGGTGITGNLYCGLHEFADMAYLLHVLRAEDLFVDVGANVGSYTVLACAARGASGYCFEPVPSTYGRLVDNLRVNDLLHRVRPMNIGLSEEAGELQFSSGEDTMNHVLGSQESREDAVRVPVKSLDEVLEGQIPALLKIDVEGFEQPVLSGARATLADPRLHSVIMELNGSGDRYGYDDDEIVRSMSDHGFDTYDYDPFTRTLKPLTGQNATNGNTLFVRNRERVQALLRSASKFSVGTRWL